MKIVLEIKKIGKNILIRKILRYFFLFIFILIIGLFAGHILGKYIISGIFTGSRTVFLMYRLPINYIYSTNLLSSGDELKRLEGYYSLLDNKIIDSDFLIRRYKMESDFIKPTIIWLIGFSSDKEKVLKFLSEESNTADQRLKQEILRTMKRFETP